MKLISKKTILFMSVLAIAGTGYHFHNKKAEANASESAEARAPQAMPVTVETVTLKPIQIWNDYSARLEAVDFAEIRPQVSGTITEVKFEDGQMVEKGDVLFVIDPRPYEAAVNQAKAELRVAKNQSSFSLKELQRAKELIKADAISERVLDERSNAHNIAVATVKAVEARLRSAEINLDYAHIKAPISGRVSRAEIKVGNLVEVGGNAPVLTSIVSKQKVYADFEVDEKSYLKYVRNSAKNVSEEHNIPVKLSLSGDDVEYEGFIQSFDNQIDVSSGTIRARALFDNEDGALLPGMFASVKMGTPSSVDQILIGERAIGTDQSRKFVYVVNDQNMVEYRVVTIGESMNGQRVITSGLNDGDQVIVEGIIRIRPGMSVVPQGKEQPVELSEQSE